LRHARRGGFGHGIEATTEGPNQVLALESYSNAQYAFVAATPENNAAARPSSDDALGSRGQPAPRICCLDLDTFFVSVERLLDPSLVGKPVVVGGKPGQRGVVTAASYEVRALGVRSGMSLSRAAELAPNAIHLPTRHGLYGEYSERVRTLARNYTPVVQLASIDEMFLRSKPEHRVRPQLCSESNLQAIRRLNALVRRELSRTSALHRSAPIAASISMPCTCD
jgi:nucleotidyltransferase/DNA polymerase involved in DNA repair